MARGTNLASVSRKTSASSLGGYARWGKTQDMIAWERSASKTNQALMDKWAKMRLPKMRSAGSVVCIGQK